MVILLLLQITEISFWFSSLPVVLIWFLKRFSDKEEGFFFFLVWGRAIYWLQKAIWAAESESLNVPSTQLSALLQAVSMG